ncbi:hypothetical protein E2C01_058756 [Portunus trituberculatus]|uniref:Uncharacterized protein n=1 Tax=Portunus trituberculatus TaxID=210409 RepID=A0A5B7H6C7_PORTR|nr:hypothetical protein [Portunus trituberculatus]
MARRCQVQEGLGCLEEGDGPGGAHPLHTLDCHYIVHVEADVELPEVRLLLKEMQRHRQLPHVDVPLHVGLLPASPALLTVGRLEAPTAVRSLPRNHSLQKARKQTLTQQPVKVWWNWAQTVRGHPRKHPVAFPPEPPAPQRPQWCHLSCKRQGVHEPRPLAVGEGGGPGGPPDPLQDHPPIVLGQADGRSPSIPPHAKPLQILSGLETRLGEIEGSQPRVWKKGLPDLLECHHPEVMTLDVGVESRQVHDQTRVLLVPPRDQEGTVQEDKAHSRASTTICVDPKEAPSRFPMRRADCAGDGRGAMACLQQAKWGERA